MPFYKPYDQCNHNKETEQCDQESNGQQTNPHAHKLKLIRRAAERVTALFGNWSICTMG